MRHEEVGKYYGAADAFVSCYCISNVGNPLLEALACGLPIVTLNTASTSDVIEDRKNGLLVEPVEDEQRLAQAVGGALARVLCDSSMARSLSAGALAFSKK